MEIIRLNDVSAEHPIKLLQIESKFDLEMNCLKIDKYYFYYEYINNRLKINEFNKKKMRGETREYLEMISNFGG